MSKRWLHFLSAALLTSALAAAAPAQSPPQVSLNAEGLTPRSIEQLTGANVSRDYARAWQDLERAVQDNRPALLHEQFAGAALERVSHRIADQNRNGLHTQIVDHGHRVKAIFYSPDGGAMQLMDDAQIQVQVFDGSRLVDSEDGPHRFIVLMTPGADRWYVRYLEEEPTPTLK